MIEEENNFFFPQFTRTESVINSTAVMEVFLFSHYDVYLQDSPVLTRTKKIFDIGYFNGWWY